MKKIILFYTLVIALLLTACGGGSAPAAPTLTVDEIAMTIVAGTQAPPAANPALPTIEIPAGANPDHIAMLATGVKSWNAWRRNNPDIIPNLTGISQIQGLNISKVNFSNAILVGANFTGTVMDKVILKGADMSNAILANADMSTANLKDAKLTGATYNNATKWPDGFDPVAAGAVLVP